MRNSDLLKHFGTYERHNLEEVCGEIFEEQLDGWHRVPGRGSAGATGTPSTTGSSGAFTRWWSISGTRRCSKKRSDQAAAFLSRSRVTLAAKSSADLPRSSNGRTSAFGAANRGSNPCRGATDPSTSLKPLPLFNTIAAPHRGPNRANKACFRKDMRAAAGCCWCSPV